MVKFLLEHLEKSGCGILDGSCWAVHCEKKIAGVYTRRGWIMVCSNHMNMQDEVNQVVIHELIHAFDDCRDAPMVNWANCPHHACSEIFVLAILVVIATVNVNFCCAKKIREL